MRLRGQARYRGKTRGEREYLQDVLAKIESGVVEAPNYKAPH